MKIPLIVIASLVVITNSSPATDLFWSGDGSSEGGTGTWDTNTAHFGASAGGPFTTVWDNTVTNNVTFESTGGIVTIGSITNYGTLTVKSDYTFTNSPSTTLMQKPNSALSVEGSSTLTVSNVFAGGPLVKNGSGTLLLGGFAAQGWTSNTVLNAGTLALGAGNGATLGVNGANNHLVINADNVTLAMRFQTGRTPQASVDQLGDLIFANGVLGASGNVQFSLAQGGTAGGTWKVKGDRKITVLAEGGVGGLLIGPANYSSGVRITAYDSSPASLTKDGPGVLGIYAENDLTGGFTNLDGQVRVAASVNNPFGTPSLTVPFNGGSLGTIGSRSTPLANPINVLGSIYVTNTTAAATPISLPFSGAFTGTSGTTLTFIGNNIAGQAFNPSFSAGFAYAGDIAINNNGSGTTTLGLLNSAGNDQTFDGLVSGSGSLSRSSASAGTGGTTYLNAANTFSGGTTLIDGAIGIGVDGTAASGALGMGTITVNPTAGCLPTLFCSGGGYYLYNAINLANDIAPLIVTGDQTLTLLGAITGPGILRKTGTGQLRILAPPGGYNTYSGGTIIAEGSIAVDNSSNGTDTGVNWGSVGKGTVTLAGGGISGLSAPNVRTIGNHILFAAGVATLGNPADGTDMILAGNVDLGGLTPTITVNNNTHAVTISGQISNGGFTKDGPTTLTLTGANSYGGGTTVSVGTLDVQADGGLGSGNVTVASGATLRLTAGAANTYINSGANVTLNGASPLVNLDFTGAPNTINALYFGAAQQASGTWGALGSGASHQSAFFNGTGLLLVSTGGGVVSTTNAIVTVVNSGSGTFTLTLLGTPGAEYFLVSSPNVAAALNTWTPVTGSTNIAPSPSGQWTFPVSATAPQYYRLKATNPAP